MVSGNLTGPRQSDGDGELLVILYPIIRNYIMILTLNQVEEFVFTSRVFVATVTGPFQRTQ